jgi:hypothetical protein
LMLAARNGRVELANSADRRRREQGGRRPARTPAAVPRGPRRPHRVRLRCCLTQGANVNATDENNRTPLLLPPRTASSSSSAS